MRPASTFPDGKVIHFNSFWVSPGSNHLIEYVNPFLGLKMAAHVEHGALHYRGVCFILKAGTLLLPIPEWLALGRTRIVEEALDDRRFAMDFRLVHPLFGEVFRYAGEFEADTRQSTGNLP